MTKLSLPISSGLKESIVVLIIASVLTVMLLGWMGYDFRYFTSVPIGDHQDTRIEAYSFSQGLDNLIHRPLNLGYSLTIYGEPSPFATFTANYGASLLILPVYLVTQSYFVTFNIYFLMAWILTALVAYWLIRYLLGVSAIIALFGTVLITFSQARVTRIAQPQEISIEFFLFTLYCLHRLIDTPKLRWAIGLCLGTFFSIFCGGYVGMMTLVTASLILVYCILTHKTTARFWRYFLPSAAVCGVLSLPFIGFRLQSSAYQTGHDYGQLLALSATVEDWFAGSSVIYKDLVPHVGAVNDVLLFIGFTPLVLAFLAWRWRKQPEGEHPPDQSRKLSIRDVVTIYGLIAVAGYLITLGPVVRLGGNDLMIAPYSLLMQLPGFSSMRALARFILLPIITTGVLSAFALHILSKRHPRDIFLGLYVALVCIFTLESTPYNSIYIDTNIFPHKSIAEAAALPVALRRLHPPYLDLDTPLNHWLAAQPAETPIFQFPVDELHTSIYLMDSLDHHQPMLNSANVTFFPAWYTDAHLERFPTPDLMALLNDHHIQYIIVHRDYLSLADNVDFNSRLQATQGTWGEIPLVQHFDNVDVYKVTQPKPTDSVRITFDKPVNGTGWSAPENGYTWTGSDSEATVKIPFVAAGTDDVSIRFRVVRILSPAILGRLRITVNGEPVSVTITSDASSALLFEGIIPREVLDRSRGTVSVAFSADLTGNPSETNPDAGAGTMGLLFDWLELHSLSMF